MGLNTPLNFEYVFVYWLATFLCFRISISRITWQIKTSKVMINSLHAKVAII